MKKVDYINSLLNQGLSPREVALRVPASLSWVYDVRTRRGIALMRHQIGELRQEVNELRQRVRLLEGKPVDIFAELRPGA